MVSVSLLVVGNNAAPAGRTQFARGKIDDVAQIGDLARDLADRLVLAALLAGFDEVQIILQQARVQNEHNAVLVAYLADLFHVFKRKRLPAHEVRSRLKTHERNLFGAGFLDDRPQLGDIAVAFERIGAGGFKALVNQDLIHRTSVQGDQRLGGRKMKIRGNDAALRNIGLRQDVFAGPSLMRREEILCPENLGEFICQPGERR